MAILLNIRAREAHDDFAGLAEAAAELRRVVSQVGQSGQAMSHRELGERLAAFHRQGAHRRSAATPGHRGPDRRPS